MNKRQLGSEKGACGRVFCRNGDMRSLPVITAAAGRNWILLQKKRIFDFY